ncbi:MAG: imidazole glycerol phosphate synthase subunit HisF [Phycisphaeraceae bacterium]
MLTHRIIPCLDVKAGRVVKGVNFVGLRDAGDPVDIARKYDAEGADELVFLDITASHEDRNIMYDVVRQVAEQCFMPFTVGGGIRTIDDVTALIQAGAEKVSINTAAITTPDIVRQTARRFGNCATVVNIDPKRVPRAEFEARRAETAKRDDAVGEAARRSEGQGPGAKGQGKEPNNPQSGIRDPQSLGPWPLALGPYVFEVHTHGGRHPIGLEAVAWARMVVELGAGEIVLTSMDGDGTKNGYDLPMTKAVADAVDVPVVASGGCGSPEHIRQVLAETRADAALAASIFHYGEYSIGETKKYLMSRGVPVRMVEGIR